MSQRANAILALPLIMMLFVGGRFATWNGELNSPSQSWHVSSEVLCYVGGLNSGYSETEWDGYNWWDGADARAKLYFYENNTSVLQDEDFVTNGGGAGVSTARVYSDEVGGYFRVYGIHNATFFAERYTDTGYRWCF